MDYRRLAIEAAKRAYCPYSNFRVGAVACVEVNGKKFAYTGVNVENASYGMTICAERVAIFKAVSETDGAFKLVSMSIACIDANYAWMNTVMPCGACRQVISEFGDDDTIIWVEGISKNFVIEELLKMPFRINNQR